VFYFYERKNESLIVYRATLSYGWGLTIEALACAQGCLLCEISLNSRVSPRGSRSGPAIGLGLRGSRI
jgi:hypothetical protein